MGCSPLLTAATTFHSDKTFYCNGRTHSRHRLSIIARFLVGCEIMVGHSYFFFLKYFPTFPCTSASDGEIVWTNYSRVSS